MVRLRKKLLKRALKKKYRKDRVLLLKCVEWIRYLEKKLEESTPKG